MRIIICARERAASDAASSGNVRYCWVKTNEFGATNFLVRVERNGVEIPSEERSGQTYTGHMLAKRNHPYQLAISETRFRSCFNAKGNYLAHCMGMDGVEIVMLAEERFGIRIADREAENVRTPGMLVDLVMGKLGETTKEMCQSQRSFYLLRRVIMRVASIDRKAIELRTSVRSFVARNNQQEFWMQLKAQIAARSWPTLGLARELEIARNVLLIVVCICAITGGWRIGFSSSSDATGTTLTAIAVGVFIAALAALFLQQLGKPFEKFIPSRISTVKDLLPFAATSNTIEWSRTDVSRVVKEIVEEVLSLGEGKYREEADFLKELGLE